MAKVMPELNLKKATDFDMFKPTIPIESTDNQDINIESRLFDLDIDRLLPYPNHPFKPYTQDKLFELAESIKENGLFQPIIVLENADSENYFILSGHNRVDACKHLDLKTIKAVIKKDISQESADLIVVESNLKQREKLFPSEKAKAYKMQLEALKKQGKRSDLIVENTDEINLSETSYPLGTKLDSGDNVAQNNDESRVNIYRYISLTNLIPTLLELIDLEAIPFRVGVELSYLKEIEQNAVHDYFFTEKKAKLDLKTSTELRELSKTKIINYETIDRLINGTLKKAKKLTKIEIPLKKLGGILDHVEEAQRVDYIMEALQFYNEIKQKEKVKNE